METRTLDPFGTHLPALMAALAQTMGPVLELGCGHYSTPILRALSPARRVVTVDTNAEWMREFADLASDNHEFHLVDDWARAAVIDQEWAVAFIDHAPGRRRAVDVLRLRGLAEFIVVHDSEDLELGLEDAFAAFPHRYDYQHYKPWTTVVSMTRRLLI